MDGIGLLRGQDHTAAMDQARNGSPACSATEHHRRAATLPQTASSYSGHGASRPARPSSATFASSGRIKAPPSPSNGRIKSTHSQIIETER